VADVKGLHEAGAGRPWAGALGPVALGLGGGLPGRHRRGPRGATV